MPCKPGVFCLLRGFASLPEGTSNRGPLHHTILAVEKDVKTETNIFVSALVKGMSDMTDLDQSVSLI